MKDATVRGNDAERLLADPLFKEAFDAVEQALSAKLKLLDVGALESMRDVVVSIQLLGKVRQYIEQVALTGRMEAAEAERRTKLRKGLA